MCYKRLKIIGQAQPSRVVPASTKNIQRLMFECFET